MNARNRTRAHLAVWLFCGICIIGGGCQTFNRLPPENADIPAAQVTAASEPGSAAPVPEEADFPAEGTAGCRSGKCKPPKAPAPLPRELDKVAQPLYRIEPPDILLIDAISVVPKPPYKISPLDTIIVQANEVLPTEPIMGLYGVESNGTVNFGFTYGSVNVDGLTIVEAQKAIEKQFRDAGFKKAEVRVSQGQSQALQQIRGQHLVRPDGTVGLGLYGSVFVAGFTVEQARAVLEAHLSQFLLKPQISVSIYAYNSKSYYVITSGAGQGEQVYRFPSTGNETVLDAVSMIGGLPPVASTKDIWLSRPTPAGSGCWQVLPVNYLAITRGGDTETNYQIMPGDRLFIEAMPLVTVDNFLARLYSPITRMFGFTLLGSAVVHTVPQHIQYRLGGGGGGGGVGGGGFGGGAF